MGEWIALAVVLVSFAVLSWFSARSPDDTELARKFRDHGGWGPLGL